MHVLERDFRELAVRIDYVRERSGKRQALHAYADALHVDGVVVVQVARQEKAYVPRATTSSIRVR